jgi:hypothetical protein
MSQHSDILKHEISKGVSRNLSVDTIVNDVGAILDCLEYDAEWTSGRILVEHVYGTAVYMRTQKDGLYGVSHDQLDKFITELWNANQWLPVKI